MVRSRAGSWTRFCIMTDPKLFNQRLANYGPWPNGTQVPPLFPYCLCCLLNCRVNWKDHMARRVGNIYCLALQKMFTSLCMWRYAVQSLLFYLVSVRSLLLVSERRTKNRGRAGEKELSQIKPHCVLATVLLNCLLSLLRNNNNNNKKIGELKK